MFDRRKMSKIEKEKREKRLKNLQMEESIKMRHLLFAGARRKKQKDFNYRGLNPTPSSINQKSEFNPKS